MLDIYDIRYFTESKDRVACFVAHIIKHFFVVSVQAQKRSQILACWFLEQDNCPYLKRNLHFEKKEQPQK